MATSNNDSLGKVWSEITGQPNTIGRSGYIPVWDGTWRLYRNTFTIYEGAENAADPAKVEALRQNAIALIDAFPETVNALEKLGLRVRRVLAGTIKNFDNVKAWAESVFNTGPVSLPEHASHTQALAYDDFTVEVDGHYLVPASPRGSGDLATLDITNPAKIVRLGPRNPLSKKAFEKRNGQAEDKPNNRLGRPRADGLPPGSPEAKKADAEKKRLYQANRRRAIKAQSETDATVTPIEEAPKRRLIRRPQPA